jgi:hypothetical protein
MEAKFEKVRGVAVGFSGYSTSNGGCRHGDRSQAGNSGDKIKP